MTCRPILVSLDFCLADLWVELIIIIINTLVFSSLSLLLSFFDNDVNKFIMEERKWMITSKETTSLKDYYYYYYYCTLHLHCICTIALCIPFVGSVCITGPTVILIVMIFVKNNERSIQTQTLQSYRTQKLTRKHNFRLSTWLVKN